MGWKETCAMEERFRFVQEYKAEEWNFAELCRRYEVSRKTGYKWLQRYEEDGLEALKDQSRAAKHHPNEVLKAVAEEILEKRRQHPHWGPGRSYISPGDCGIKERRRGGNEYPSGFG